MITLQNSKNNNSKIWIIGMLKTDQENWICGAQRASQKCLSLLACMKIGKTPKGLNGCIIGY